MNTKPNFWELNIIDVPNQCEGNGIYVADIYGNDERIVITSGNGRGGLTWYNMKTGDKGSIADGYFSVGVWVEDVDDDGVKEVLVAEESQVSGIYRIVGFKAGKTLHDPWMQFIIDPACTGCPHDVVANDIDGDGRQEILTMAAETICSGFYVYTRDDRNPYGFWNKFVIAMGHSSEGIQVCDLDGDGKNEIISGVYCYHAPTSGFYAGLWTETCYAESFRTCCRMVAVDITGNGRPDIVSCESEYLDGQLSWFENRIREDPEKPWIEHRLADSIRFGHSLDAVRESGVVRIVTAEMSEGGWNTGYNADARLFQYVSKDNGNTFTEEKIYHGQGTHQGFLCDIDNDGELEFISKTYLHANVHFFKKPAVPSPFTSVVYTAIDRDKEYSGIDMFVVDLNGDGLEDVLVAKYWYEAPNWERHEIPGVFQVVGVYDIDGDGKSEVIAIKSKLGDRRFDSFYSNLTMEFWWLKLVDPDRNIWEEHFLAKGNGGWPHGACLGKVLNGGSGLALFIADHDNFNSPETAIIQVFAASQDPALPWQAIPGIRLPISEEMKAVDIDGDGKLEIVAFPYCIKFDDDNRASIRKLAADPPDKAMSMSRLDICDLTGSGLPDIVVCEQNVSADGHATGWGRVVWYENPGNEFTRPWEEHVIDLIRSPHSLCVADLDGDGVFEIIVAEHYPSIPNRTRSRLFVYKAADNALRFWKRYMLDDRFEHHDGTRPIRLSNGKFGIVSHGWCDSQYVHLWEMP